MAPRVERVARNEAISREINEDLEGAHEGSAPDRYVRMVCECGRDECESLIAISLAEYERVRADPRRFAVVAEHVVPDIERVVDEHERFVTVEKTREQAAEIVEDEDPRG